jgi:hypothetical protein
MFTKERRNTQIDSYYRRIGRSIESFHVSCDHNSGQVFLGTWNNTPVALKVLTTQGGIVPSSMVRYGINIADE